MADRANQPAIEYPHVVEVPNAHMLSKSLTSTGSVQDLNDGDELMEFQEAWKEICEVKRLGSSDLGSTKPYWCVLIADPAPRYEHS